MAKNIKMEKGLSDYHLHIACMVYYFLHVLKWPHFNLLRVKKTQKHYFTITRFH